MKKTIIIDGENFVHSVVSILKAAKILHDRRSLRKINLALMLERHQLDPKYARYYMTKIHMPEAGHNLFVSANQMRLWNKRWLPYLANQGVILVRAGILKVRDGKKCKHCGKSTEVLLEKGVDVRIAVDMIESKDHIYLISSDSDLIPAIRTKIKSGGKVTYVYFEDQKNQALCKVASRVIKISAAEVKRAFIDANEESKT